MNGEEACTIGRCTLHKLRLERRCILRSVLRFCCILARPSGAGGSLHRGGRGRVRLRGGGTAADRAAPQQASPRRRKLTARTQTLARGGVNPRAARAGSARTTSRTSCQSLPRISSAARTQCPRPLAFEELLRNETISARDPFFFARFSKVSKNFHQCLQNFWNIYRQPAVVWNFPAIPTRV